MEEIVIKPSRWKYGFFLAFALGFVAIGWMMIHDASSAVRIKGWFVLAVFGPCVPLFAFAFFDRRPRLVFDAHGVFDRTLWVGTIAWSDIVDADLARLGGGHFIRLMLKDESVYLDRLSPFMRKVVRANRLVGGNAFNLNLSGIAASPKEVLAALQIMLFRYQFPESSVE